MRDSQTPGQETLASTMSPPRVEMPGGLALGLAVELFADSIAQAVVEVVGLLLECRRKNAHKSIKYQATSAPILDKAM
jgi:hypothetical protein